MPMLKEALIFNTIEKYKNYSEAEQWHPNVIHIHANGVNYKQIDFFLKEYVDSALILESCNFPLISDYAAYVDIHLQYSYWCLWQFLYRKRQAKAKTGIPIVFPRLMITDHFYFLPSLLKKQLWISGPKIRTIPSRRLLFLAVVGQPLF